MTTKAKPTVEVSRLIADAMNGDRGDDQQRIAREGVKWIHLLLNKNSDYGSSAWKPPVLCPSADARTAILVRMSDKIERIQSLQKKLLEGKQPEVNESFEDTLRDLGAYCLLYLAAPADA